MGRWAVGRGVARGSGAKTTGALRGWGAKTGVGGGGVVGSRRQLLKLGRLPGVRERKRYFKKSSK